MIIFLHVLTALSSLAFTTYAYFRPSAVKLRVSYALAGLTLASGLYLVISAPAHMIEACIMGLFYLGLVSVGISATRLKLVLLDKKV